MHYVKKIGMYFEISEQLSEVLLAYLETTPRITLLEKPGKHLGLAE